MPFWSKTCEKDMAVMDAGAKKDLTSFVEGMDRKEKKELLGPLESKFQASNAAAPSIPVREPLQARRVQRRGQRRTSTPLTRPHLSPIFNMFRLSKSESRSTVPSLTSRFEKRNLPPWPQLGRTGRIKSKPASRCVCSEMDRYVTSIHDESS